MAIKPVPGYKPQPGPGGPVPKAVYTAPKVAAAPKPLAMPKSALGMAGLGIQPGYVTQAKTAAAAVTPWGPATAPGTATSVPRSAVPSNYAASLADITGHPLYQGALGQHNTNMQSLMRALQSNLGSAVIKSGYDPTAAFQKLMADRPDLGEFADLLDPAAIATAGTNPLSERMMNQQTYDRGLERQAYSLAARGMGQSGAAATGTNALLENRQLAENQSRDALLQAIQGGMTGYLGAKTQGFTALQDTAAQVAQLLAQQEGAVRPEGNADLNTVAAAQANEKLVPGTNVPSAASAPTNYINWGGGQIKNVNQMKQWLGARGQNWNTWAIQHPALAQQLLSLS